MIKTPVLAAALSSAELPRAASLEIPVHRVDSQEQKVPLKDLFYSMKDLCADTEVAVQATPGSPLAGQILLANRSDLLPGASARSAIAVIRLTERAGPPVAVKRKALDLVGATPSVQGRNLVRGRAVNGWLAGGIAFSLAGLSLLIPAALIEADGHSSGCRDCGGLGDLFAIPSFVFGGTHLLLGLAFVGVGAKRGRTVVEAASPDVELLHLDAATASTLTEGFSAAKGRW